MKGTGGWGGLAGVLGNNGPPVGRGLAQLAHGQGLSGVEVAPLERAAARTCREARAPVTTTLLTDLNLPTIDRVDNRRIEVIAHGLPLFQGAQLAVDTTLASPLSATSQPRRRDGTCAGAALRDARRAKERVYLTRGGRCRLVVLGLEIGGCWPRPGLKPSRNNFGPRQSQLT